MIQMMQKPLNFFKPKNHIKPLEIQGYVREMIKPWLLIPIDTHWISQTHHTIIKRGVQVKVLERERVRGLGT